MKRFRNSYIIAALLIVSIFLLPFCTKNDQVLNTTPEVPINSSTDLVSIKVTAPPVIDGTIDAMWENSPKLTFSTGVPEVTGDIFRGYVGNIIPRVTLRSTYDDQNIYILTEWLDPTQSVGYQPWFFDPATQRWAQESGNPTFSTTGSITRPAFYEDKAAFLWNVNNSVNGWNSATCYSSCHTGLPASDGSSRHFTNFATEKIDMWHWKAVRGGLQGGYQADDQYQDNTYPNGRKSDAGNQAYANNRKSLVITGSSPAITVNVPSYVIPGRTNYAWILKSEVDASTAKSVTAVSASGILTLSDGAEIDPNVGTDYQRVGTGVGPKAIPALVISSFTESRGDIDSKATFTAGSGWVLEMKRALKTADDTKDVDFSSLSDQYFGFAIFENAQIAHSIRANLVLKFQK